MNAAHTDLVRSILLAVSPLGLCWSNDTPGLAYTRDGKPFKSGLTGSSDILACIKGRFVGIECKTGKSQLSTPQRRFRDAVIRSNGVFIEARSVDQVMACLKSEGLA
ncbi:hypothetical protein [Sphingobium sp.]|uniref:hypothetical protein n=1 Tax=Sphingobium sp. TaxID=1912891 RepID=UPI00257E8945|nr:hypothetical protein [Sphingobium sp.]MBR2268770.1 hypothetical protein [Sphingobium sp.]